MKHIELACIVGGASSIPKPPDLGAVRREARKMPYARLLSRVLSQRGLLEERTTAFKEGITSKENALKQRAAYSSKALRELGVEPVPESEIPPELGTSVPVDLLEASSDLYSHIQSGRVCLWRNREELGTVLSRMIGVSKLRAGTVFGEVFAPATKTLSKLPPAPDIEGEIPTFFTRLVPGILFSSAASVAVSLIYEGFFVPVLTFAGLLASSALSIFGKVRRERKMMVNALQFFAVHFSAIDNMEKAANSELTILSEVYGNVEKILEFLNGERNPEEVKPPTLH